MAMDEAKQDAAADTGTKSTTERNAVMSVRQYHQPQKFRDGCITVEIDAQGPVDALDYADVMKNTIEALNATAAAIDRDEGREPEKLSWQLVEAAVIGRHAVFTVYPLTEKQVKAAKAKTVAKDRERDKA
jgi:hypothetical protein